MTKKAPTPPQLRWPLWAVAPSLSWLPPHPLVEIVDEQDRFFPVFSNAELGERYIEARQQPDVKVIPFDRETLLSWVPELKRNRIETVCINPVRQGDMLRNWTITLDALLANLDGIL